MPLDARTLNWPRSPTIAWVSSVHTPVALIDLLGLDLELVAVLEVAHPDADDPLPLAQEPDDARPVGDLRAVGGRGPDDVHRVPGVVDLGVVVLDGADEGVLAQARHRPQRLACGSGAGGTAGRRRCPPVRAMRS